MVKKILLVSLGLVAVVVGYGYLAKRGIFPVYVRKTRQVTQHIIVGYPEMSFSYDAVVFPLLVYVVESAVEIKCENFWAKGVVKYSVAGDGSGKDKRNATGKSLIINTSGCM